MKGVYLGVEQDNYQNEDQAVNGNRVWKIATGVLLLALIAAIVIPLFTSPGGGDEVVATVNGTDIMKDQYYEEMVRTGGGPTLDYMIENELVRQEAKKAGIQVSEADVDAEVETVKSSFGSDEMFEQALAQFGTTEADLRKDLEMQVMIRKLLEPKVAVTDEDVADFYEANKDMYAEEETVRASHILVKTKEEAETLLKELEGGADFAALAKEHTLDTMTKDVGGDLDYFPRGVMDKAFEEAAFTLAVGETSGAVETSYGFHIIKVTDHKEAHTPTLEEKKGDIKQQLVDQEIKTLAESWLAETKAAATIEKF